MGDTRRIQVKCNRASAFRAEFGSRRFLGRSTLVADGRLHYVGAVDVIADGLWSIVLGEISAQAIRAGQIVPEVRVVATCTLSIRVTVHPVDVLGFLGRCVLTWGKLRLRAACVLDGCFGLDCDGTGTVRLIRGIVGGISLLRLVHATDLVGENVGIPFIVQLET